MIGGGPGSLMLARLPYCDHANESPFDLVVGADGAATHLSHAGQELTLAVCKGDQAERRTACAPRRLMPRR
jgi:hypothetical protein